MVRYSIACLLVLTIVCLLSSLATAFDKSSADTFIPRHQNPHVSQSAMDESGDDAVASLFGAVGSSVPDDRYWKQDLSPSIPGLNGPVYAMIEFDGELVVAGRFTIAGNTRASCIAAWNGATWRSLCDSIDGGSNLAIEALTVWDGKLVAGGDFTYIGGAKVRHLAQWDGTFWSPVSVGIGEPDGFVFSLAAYQGKLIVGGEYLGSQYTSGIASFDGQTWMSLGSSDPSRQRAIEVLLVHDDLLWAGGFTRNSPTEAYLECWNGTSWSKPSGGLTGGYMTVLALAYFQNHLYVGGSFAAAGATPAANLARYDGTEWHALAAQPNGNVYSMAEYKGRLFVAGGFTVIGSDTVHHVAAWNGTEWDTRDSYFSGTTYDLCLYQDKLFAGGSSMRAGADSIPAWRIAQWDSTEWSPLVIGMSGQANAMILHNGELVLAGGISLAGSGDVHSLIRWDGSSWEPFYEEPEGSVNCLTQFEGTLLASGSFASATPGQTDCILQWNGVEWSSLGQGLTGQIRATAVYRDTLYVGGALNLPGRTTPVGVARWEGSSWTSVGNWETREVYALEVNDDRLWVGGRFFKTIGDSANYLASWDGTQWSAPPSLNGAVFALHSYKGDLAVGGHFTASGLTSLNRVALLKDTTWVPFLSGFYGDVYCFAEHAGRLIAGGNFLYAIYQTTYLHNLGAWNGTQWIPLGSGGNGSVNAMISRDSDLVVVGSFTAMGAEAASVVARWTKGCCDGTIGNVDYSSNDVVDLSDLSVLIMYLTESESIDLDCTQEADINGSGVDLSDLSLLIAYFIQRPRPLLPVCP